MERPYIVTVILNTNRREDTLECLRSLARGAYPRHGIIVLDNASTDGSPEAVRAEFPAVKVIGLTQNLGYAGNNNVGIRAALADGADWVFVLNEDVIVDPECLGRMMDVAESDPKVGVLGPMVYHHDEPTVIQSAGGRLGPKWETQHIGQNEPDTNQFPGPRQVEWISGCAILVRREVIEQVGVLDERFFYYWEETEWCVRAGRGGWKIMHAPQAKIWHKGVQRDYKPKPSVSYYNTRNRLLMLSKHQAPLLPRVAAWGQITRTLASMTLRPKWRNQRGHRDAIYRGVVDYFRQRWGPGPF